MAPSANSKGNNVHHHFQLLFVWQKLEKLMNSHFSFSICSFHLKWRFHLPLILFLSLTSNSHQNLMFITLQINYRHHLERTAKFYNSIAILFIFAKALYPASLCKCNNKKNPIKKVHFFPLKLIFGNYYNFYH